MGSLENKSLPVTFYTNPLFLPKFLASLVVLGNIMSQDSGAAQIHKFFCIVWRYCRVEHSTLAGFGNMLMYKVSQYYYCEEVVCI